MPRLVLVHKTRSDLWFEILAYDRVKQRAIMMGAEVTIDSPFRIDAWTREHYHLRTVNKEERALFWHEGSDSFVEAKSKREIEQCRSNIELDEVTGEYEWELKYVKLRAGRRGYVEH